ncbi:AIPR family protein [Vibrio breoganii]|uniref:AIPR family protein n=1 Tax=Vibrio breoganii TaxID=553239 RepID=UPI000C865884|nr:AIPR family protein [Vibrio breoganii]PMK37663.1 abortive phage infection protein [Vibrio breoganii]
MELISFLEKLRLDIKEEFQNQLTGNPYDAPFEEAIFVKIMVEHMVDVGMSFENPQLLNYQAKVGNVKVRVSGYSYSDDNEDLDLYVSLYQEVSEITELPKAEIGRSLKDCYQFLTQAAMGKMDGKLPVNSEVLGFVQLIKQTFHHLEQIRVYLITDCVAKSREFQPIEHDGKTIKLEVMDLERLYNHWQSGKPRDELIVDFKQAWNEPLPCVWVPGQASEYDYAMTAIPGDVLRYLYDRYGSRILEANVRSFLSQTGKVNKGIRDTLRNNPEHFMAYNNGVVIVADDISIEASSTGIPGIGMLKGMQIVNGGQTTASIFFTKKKYKATELENVRVPAKIIVLNKASQDEEQELVANIAKYANSQNAVNQSDLAANNPFHISLEKLSNSTYLDDGMSRWFYERARGSYKVLIEREGKTPAGMNKLKKLIPPSRKITKTDMVKYVMTWDQKPDIVSKGGQTTFGRFMEELTSASGEVSFTPDQVYFKDVVAKAILFKETAKLTRPIFDGYWANINTYTLSCLSRDYNESFDLSTIWKKQSLSSGLKSLIISYSKQVNDILIETSSGRNVSQWAKQPGCKDVVFQRVKYITSSDYIPEIKNA